MTPKNVPAVRPTLRAIARRAGLSLAAASMAMRNHPGVGAKTRARVQELARKMGYHPDPKLSALMQHLRTHSDSEYRETIAYLSTYARYEDWKIASQHDYFVGASRRALDLGYRVEAFHLGEPGMTSGRMSRLLEARGVRGLLVGGFEQAEARLDLAWKRFAAVTFAYSIVEPVLHRVSTDYYKEMLAVLERLQGEGRRRIGLHVRIRDDLKAHGLWRAAYLLFQESLPRGSRLAIHGGGDPRRWQEKWRPDAIVSAGCDFPLDYEEACGKAPPSRVAYVNMNIHHADVRSRGIDQDSQTVGRLACEHLVAMLQRNEVGLPARPQVILVEGEWVEDRRAWSARKRAGEKVPA